MSAQISCSEVSYFTSIWLFLLQDAAAAIDNMVSQYFWFYVCVFSQTTPCSVRVLSLPERIRTFWADGPRQHRQTHEDQRGIFSTRWLERNLLRDIFTVFSGFNCDGASPTVWSDDDWLKKFSGKTVEEAEGEAKAGEVASTTQEVRLLFSYFMLSLLKKTGHLIIKPFLWQQILI